MNIKCVVVLPESVHNRYQHSMMNFKQKWAEVFMEKREDGLFDAELIGISNGEGIVKFKQGVLIKLPVENICIVK